MKNSDFWYLVSIIYIAQIMPAGGVFVFSIIALIAALYYTIREIKDND